MTTQPRNATTASLVTAPEVPVTMERMSQAPEHSEGGSTPTTTLWRRSLQADSTRRALALTALGGLLIAGLLTALPQSDLTGNRTANAISLGPRGNDTFDHAESGDCLNWPDRTPDAAELVDCAEEHRFEVAESVDMRAFPGSEYGPDAEPADQPRAVFGGCEALSGGALRSQQPIHRQHAVVRRQGLAALRRAQDALWAAAAGRQQPTVGVHRQRGRDRPI